MPRAQLGFARTPRQQRAESDAARQLEMMAFGENKHDPAVDLQDLALVGKRLQLAIRCTVANEVAEHFAGTGEHMLQDAVHGIDRYPPDVHVYYSWHTNPDSGIKYSHHEFLLQCKGSNVENAAGEILSLPIKVPFFAPASAMTEHAQSILRLFPAASASSIQYTSAPGMSQEQWTQLAKVDHDASVQFQNVNAQLCPKLMNAKPDSKFVRAPDMTQQEHAMMLAKTKAVKNNQSTFDFATGNVAALCKLFGGS